MRSLKKTIALLLSMAIMAISTAVYADVPENVESHTFTVEVPAANETANGSTTIIPGASPMIWGQTGDNLSSYGKFYSSPFNVSQNYFAFETVARTSSGGTASSTYIASLMYGTSTPIASMENYVDGLTHKLDWISIPFIGSNYLIRLENRGTTPITVSVTYYSWN